MPRSKFVVSNKTSNTFKANKVKAMFDCDMDEVKKEFDVQIPIENIEWNVGLIVGASGSGKTTIAKNCFDDFVFFEGYEWSGESIIDDFPDDLSAKQITEILSKVGFASPPDWLKPFSVLSNGQKMRAELARLIVSENRPVIYDEFTSVVDRQVAKIGSHAIQKFIRKEKKQFVAVSCHYDIEEWLEPDWVFDVNKNKFYRGCLRRPQIEINIRRAEQSEWQIFKQHHYLSAAHNNAAHKYIAEIDGAPVAWCSVLHLPHPKRKNLKKIHRIVVLPDYQGIGVASRFMDHICAKYVDEGYSIGIVTSSPSLIFSLYNSKSWTMTRKPGRLQNTAGTGVLAGTTSDARLTASFEYNAKTKKEKSPVFLKILEQKRKKHARPQTL